MPINRETFKNMANALNEIRLDFENEDEKILNKTEVLQEIRNDLMDVYWNYDLKSKKRL